MKIMSLVSTFLAASLAILPAYAHGDAEDQNHHLLNDAEQQVHHQVNDGNMSPQQHQAIDQQLSQQHAQRHGAGYGGNGYYNSQPSYNAYGSGNYNSNQGIVPGYNLQSGYGAGYGGGGYGNQFGNTGYGNQFGYGQHRQEHRVLRQERHQVHDMAKQGLISPLQHQQLDRQVHNEHDNMDGKHRF